MEGDLESAFVNFFEVKDKGRYSSTQVSVRVIVPTKKEDLDSLSGGEIVRVTLKKPYRNWEVYEGLINGEYCFMHQDQNRKEINSFRIPVDDLKIDKNGWFGVLANGKDRLVVINPDNPNYEAKKQMLQVADKWWD